jgi:hypothetical protein
MCDKKHLRSILLEMLFDVNTMCRVVTTGDEHLTGNGDDENPGEDQYRPNCTHSPEAFS